jgi:HEAT repeat protein
MVATVGALVQVRSTLAESIAAYYAALLLHIDQLPWAGRRASDLAIPVRVLKESAVLRESQPRSGDGPHERRPAERHVDQELARVYEEPTRRSLPVQWEHERERIERCVVIGPPGGGKTFLTVMTAIDLARQGQFELNERTLALDELPLPFWFELKTLGEGPLRDPAQFLLDRLQVAYTGQLPPGQWLCSQFSQRNCWLILDGLDELDASQARQLRGFLESVQVAGWQCRLLLTCRTADYNASALPWRGPVTEYELAPLEGSETGDLIRRWYGDDPRGTSLERVVNRSYSLRHACRSPLLVALACATNQDRALAEETTRRDLYRLGLDGVLRELWKQNGPRQGSADDLRVDDLKRLLPEVAWKLFIQTPRNLYLNEQVVDAIVAVNQGGRVRGGAAEIRDELVLRGLLRGAGRDGRGRARLSFLHRTFLEYLAAEWLLTAVNRVGWENAEIEWAGGPRSVSLLIRKKAWLAEWQEIIILLTAGADVVGVDRMMHWLLKEEDDDLYLHRRILAAMCMVEVAVPVREQLTEWVDWLTATIYRAGDTALTLAAELDGVCEDGLTLIESVLRNADWRVIRMIYPMAGRHPEIIPALLRAFSETGDEYPVGYIDVDDALGAMGAEAVQHPEVVPALLRALRAGGPWRRARAARVLGMMGPAAASHPQVIPALLHSLQEQLNYELASVGEGDDSVDSEFRYTPTTDLVSYADYFLRHGPKPVSTTIWALGKIGAILHPDVIPALLHFLKECRDRFVEGGFATDQILLALGAMGPQAAIHQDVIPAFLSLTDREYISPETLGGALRGMRREAARHHDLIPTLLDTLRNGKEEGRLRAAYALTALGVEAARHPDVISTLIRFLETDDRPRLAFGEKLGSMIKESSRHPDMVELLLNTLKCCEIGGLIYSVTDAINALGVIGAEAARHPGVIPALLGFLYDERFYGVGEYAIYEIDFDVFRALESMGAEATRHPDVVPTLARCFTQCANDDAASALIRLLGAEAAHHPDFIPGLLRSRDEGDNQLHFVAVLCLGELGVVAVRHPRVIPALLGIRGKDNQLRGDAVRALADMGVDAMRHPRVIPAILELARFGYRGHDEFQGLYRASEFSYRGLDLFVELGYRFFDLESGRYSTTEELAQLPK